MRHPDVLPTCPSPALDTESHQDNAILLCCWVGISVEAGRAHVWTSDWLGSHSSDSLPALSDSIAYCTPTLLLWHAAQKGLLSSASLSGQRLGLLTSLEPVDFKI